MQEAALKGPTSPFEVYSCDLHVMDPVEDGLQVICMTTKDWQQTQLTDPILGQVVVKMQDGTLGQCLYQLTESPKLWWVLCEFNHLKLRQSIVYREVLQRGTQEVLFQLVLPATYWETIL